MISIKIEEIAVINDVKFKFDNLDAVQESKTIRY